MPSVPELWKLFSFRELTTNHRQEGDHNTRWRELLAHARYGVMDADDVKYLSARLINTAACKSSSEYLNLFVAKFLECEAMGSHPVCLLPKRSMCQEFNSAVMKQKGLSAMRILAQDRIFCDKRVHKKVVETLKELDDRETGGFPESIDLAVNGRVMLRINDKRVPGLVNGSRGTVREIIKDRAGHFVSQIMIKFDDIDEVQCIERKEKYIQVMPGCHVYRNMFPLINSYAMTIHKSQSLSLPCVFVDLGNSIFCSGMSYVALSRCKSHEGLHVMNLNCSKIVASKNACREYSRLKSNLHVPSNTVTIGKSNERTWYTTNAQMKASRALTADISNVKSNVKPKNPPKRKSNPAKRKCTDTGHVAAKTSKPNNGAEVIIGRVEERLFTYSPVREQWQRTMCNAFGWPFHSISRPEHVMSEDNVETLRRAHQDTPIIGDGNCWYRTVSHIVTGTEAHFEVVK